jgi:site-specific DNA recombinase
VNIEKDGRAADIVKDAVADGEMIEVQSLAPVVQVRKAKKKKKGGTVRREYEVQVIPATKGVTPVGEEAPAKRVAAYCRVSTDQEAQSSSYELQVQHYTEYIGAHENWVLAGIYADEGITGTQLKHRDQFLKMIEDCEAGKIDMIITKSISRFARNTVDCLTIIRKLKGLKEPVEIYFEKERLYSLDEKTDMVLSLMASIAQEESRSISANIRWAIRNRMKNGTQKIPTSGLLGYDTDEDGNMVIITQEAEVVRTIYKSFVQGVHPSLIAIRLNALGLKTVYGNDWSGSSIRNILRNEKYCGDVLMQKTITVDYLSHISKPNEGEAEQYYIADHHDAIVSRELWDKAQELLEKQSWQKWKRREQQRLMPVRTGLLTGFVSINGTWKTVSITRLLTASNKVMEAETGTDIVDNQLKTNNADETANYNNESEDVIMSELSILEGFEVVDLEQSRGDSVLTLTSTNLKFNKATAVELGFPAYVRMLVNAVTRQVAIQPCNEKSKNAVEFSKEKTKQTYAVVVKIPALLTTVRKLAEVDEDAGSLSFRGTLYPNDRVIIYDLTKGEPVKTRGRKKRDDMKEEVEQGQATTSAEE